MKPVPLDKNISGLVSRIKTLLFESRNRIAQTVNEELLLTYWKIGKAIAEFEQTGVGSSREFIIDLSKQLTEQEGKGFSRSNLFNMRNFFLQYSVQTLSGHTELGVQTVSGHTNLDVQTLSGHFLATFEKLSWSHYCELMVIDDKYKRSFYEKESLNSRWSLRELKRQLETSLYERLLLSEGKPNKDKIIELAEKGHTILKPSDIIKDPYILDFLGLSENKVFLEADLEERLIRKIEDFLLELGKGFMFVGSQQRITLNNTHYYVDMVFYHKILKSYVLIDLKTGKFKGEDAGQMNMYLNYYKIEINTEEDSAPIGIILCAEKDHIAAEYALGGLTNHIFASKYKLHLPEEAVLEFELQRLINS